MATSGKIKYSVDTGKILYTSNGKISITCAAAISYRWFSTVKVLWPKASTGLGGPPLPDDAITGQSWFNVVSPAAIITGEYESATPGKWNPGIPGGTGIGWNMLIPLGGDRQATIPFKITFEPQVAHDTSVEPVAADWGWTLEYSNTYITNPATPAFDVSESAVVPVTPVLVLDIGNTKWYAPEFTVTSPTLDTFTVGPTAW